MTHQNHQTNGASLEDCHTNFYALTDLCGIKWRKFVNSERPNASSDPLADPILRSYSRCMQADMLCVWRRVQSTKQDNTDPNALNFEITTSTRVHPPLSLAAAKELWIFWYGEEPDLSELVDAELLRVAANQALWNGTWKGELTYECRSLLFKALHNLMERFVLTKDIVRFGKWFVQPCTSSDRLFGRSSQHLSFSFTFFVHGDTVCASIDLREHPAVRPLTKEDLAEAAAAFAAATTSTAAAANSNQSSATTGTGAPGAASAAQAHEQNAAPSPLEQGGNDGASAKAATPPHARKVMLAPFGIAAILTGNSYKASDPMAEKILEDWDSFFPLCNKDNSDVPPVVEVVSGGHKMYHPTNYVLVTDLDDMEQLEFAELNKAGAATSTPATATAAPTSSAAEAASLNCPPTAAGGAKEGAVVANRKAATAAAASQAVSALERLTFQPYYDQRPTSGFTFNINNTHIPASAAIEMPERAWQDCVTNMLHVEAAGNATSAATQPDEDEQNKPPSNQTQTDSKQAVQQQIQQQQQQQRQKLWNFVDPMQKAPCICTKHLSNVTNTPHGTPHGGASTYSRNSLGGDSSLPVASVGSPATPAPSPHPHPNSAHSQPTSVPPAEQLINMSPHAPTSVSNLHQPPTPIDHLLDKNTPAPTPTDQHDSKSITASPYVHQTPSVEPPSYTEAVLGGVTAPHTAGGPGSVPQQQQQQQVNASANAAGSTAGQPNAQCGTISVKKLEMQQQQPHPQHPLQMGGSGGGSSGTIEIKQEPGLALTAAVPQAPAISTTEAITNLLNLYKPPQLTLKDPDSFYDEEWLKDVVFDFTFQDSWDYLPVKRPKLSEVSKIKRPRYAKNLYEGHTHFKPLMPSPGSVYGAQLLSIDAATHAAAHSDNGGAGSASGGLVGIANSNASSNSATNGGGSGNNGTDDTDNGLTGSYFQGLDIKTETGLHSPCKESKSTSTGGNLFTAEGLNPSINDLEQLFDETSSNDECSSVQIHTPPDSNNPSNGGCSAVTNTIDELKRSTAVASVVVAAAAAAAAGNAAIAALQNCGGGSGSGANAIQAEDLTKMFPTPPSHEQQHPNSSPCQADVVMTDLSVDTTTNVTATAATIVAPSVNSLGMGLGLGLAMGVGVMVKIKQEYSVELGSPVEEPIDDWSYVYRPPQQEKFLGSSRYAPLTNLPSKTLPPLQLPSGCVYKPTWASQKSRAAAVAKAAAAQQQQQQKHQQLQHHIQQHQAHQQQQQQQQQQHKHQQLHELLSAGPRTPQQQPRTPLGPMPSPGMHGNTVPTPLSSGGSNLLLNQLNCPPAALTNQPGGSMQHLMQRAGMSPISPGPGGVPFPRSSPMMRQTPIHPPPPYELAVASPATSTSSYLNKQYNSQEHPHTPQSVHHMHGSGPGGHALHGGVGAGGVGSGGSALAGGGGVPGQSMALYSGDAGIATSAANNSNNLINELPEVNSVLVNILLYDTALNVFRDHNFDSSTVCVCNWDNQKIGNIRGADSGVYVPLPGASFNPFPTQTSQTTQRLLSSSGLPNGSGPNGSNVFGGNGGLRMLSAFGGALDSPASLPGAGSGHPGSNSSSCTPPSSNPHITGYVDDDPVDCTCGFSAVVNRRLSHRAGLFYEDELEITGIADDPGRNKQPTLLSLIQSLCRKSQTTKASSGDANSGALEKAGQASTAHMEQLAHTIFDLLLDQCSIIQTTSSSVHRALQSHRRRMSRQKRLFGNSGAPAASMASIANVLEFMDAHDVISLALEQARLAFENQRVDIMEFGSAQNHQQLSAFQAAPPALRQKLQVLGSGRLTVHKWPYLPVGFTRSNKEIVRTMNSIQPMLQNAFHSKSRGGAAGSKDASSYNTVSGPLTWRQFHRLAGRASGQCEPQPIPSVIVGYEKDWISVAPHSIHYWDKFLLEPYSYARDVVYLVVCPDNEHVTNCTRTYFRELSSTYEMCKLGRHTPIRGWEGILTVGPRNPTGTNESPTPLDEWLRTLDHVQLAEQIRRYAVAFLHQLAPYLSRVPSDKTLLNPPDQNNSGAAGQRADRNHLNNSATGNGLNTSSGGVGDCPEPTIKIEPGTVPPETQSSNDNDSKADAKGGDTKPALVLGDPLGVGETLEDINPPAIVLYVVNPFTFATDSSELERLALIALLRCYAELLKALPESVRANMNIQIISLESVMELGPCGNRKRFSDEIKCLALNIFSQCRRHLVHAQSVKSLTGFGTAANMEAFLKTKDEQNRRAYKMYTAPFVLAPMHERNDKTDFSRAAGSMHGQNEHRYSVMYCNYCLSEDQSWLLATATDDRGELLEKVCINIDVPNRLRRRKAPARYVALKKLMDFIMGLISQTSQMWRLVIGRIGRIGHSELKSWSYLLSKQQLQKASKQFKDMCKQCTLMYPPTILSACLVTLEPDAKLRVMPDQFTPDERFSQISMQNPLSTPQDVTCTHILVFPTSAVCASFTRQFQNDAPVDDDFLTFGEEEGNEDFSDADIGELFWETHMDPVSNHGSPGRMEDNRSWPSGGANNFKCTPAQEVEEVGSLNQQPISVGYMVSTAPTGRMPAWFWSACPHLEDVCPVFLKTALHLHVPNIQTTDDILNSTNAHQSAYDHPLDSTLTADVLRFVLEGYNALSWLALDSNTHDRLSCLPINVQTLMDLYYLTAAIA